MTVRRQRLNEDPFFPEVNCWWCFGVRIRTGICRESTVHHSTARASHSPAGIKSASPRPCDSVMHSPGVARREEAEPFRVRMVVLETKCSGSVLASQRAQRRVCMQLVQPCSRTPLHHILRRPANTCLHLSSVSRSLSLYTFNSPVIDGSCQSQCPGAVTHSGSTWSERNSSSDPSSSEVKSFRNAVPESIASIPAQMSLECGGEMVED